MNSKFEYREEAVPFVIYNQEKRLFEINDDAFDYLKQLPGPLGIISVAGMYRTGKSYLLNRMLLNRSGGFGVGPTINPCTKGIWIWGKPIQGFTPEGEPINVLVIDTEGLGALDEDSNHDVRIFSIAILISSFFLYNSVGSIDENALSQLSLVINLTKHIHLKSTGMTDDVDPEEYSQYFPSFMWVVRDFALQLMDIDGEQITPKEYLEKALQPQKGFTDAVEQKNRIRRLLKSFFQERDCCTMIRPLTKEENLQSLEKMQLEELRPEFVEQVMTLRRKVLNRVKPKLMHGKKLNGEMLFNLALSYVDAINKGVVPNIETAWSYICKNECQKAQMDSYDKFERNLLERFSENQPVFDDELKEMYQEIKKTSLEDFQKIAVGDIQKEYLNGLKEKMRGKYQQLRNENSKISEQAALMFLQNNYQQVERKLKNQEYSSIYDLVEELKNFQLYFIDHGPPGPNRMTVLMDFVNKSLIEASEFMFRHQENELRIQKTINSDTINKLQSSLQEVKDENRQKVDQLENKIRNSEMDKADLSAREQSTKEALAQKVKDFQQYEIETQEKVDQLKKDNQRQLDECKNMVHQSEENAKEVQRQRMAMESEGDKQKALLEQRIEFLEKQIEDYAKKEKELNNDVKNQKRDYLSTQKEAQKTYEQQIKDLNKKYEDALEKVFDWENKYQELEQKYDQEVQKLEDTDFSQKKELTKVKDVYADLQRQFDSLKKKYQQDVEQLRLDSEDDRQSKSEKIVEYESRVKQLEEQQEISKQKWEKDQAIYRQKQEFLELQLKDERTKYEQQRQDHDSMMNKIHSRERESVIGKEDSQKRMQNLQDQLNREMQETEQKYETQKQKLQTMVDQLTDRNQELEISLKIQVGDFEKEISALREQLHNSEEAKMKAQDLIKNLDAQKIRILEDNEKRHLERETYLQKELDEKNKDFEDSFKEIQEKSEEQLAQLKNFYEIEKDRLERRLQEEKDRAQKRYNVMVDDYEQKLKEELQQKDEDMELQQDEFRGKEGELNELISQLQHENSLRHQSIESLESYLQETKESLNNMQNTSSMTLEKQLEKFNEERRDTTNKIDKLQQEITRKERTITSLENQKDSHSMQVAQKDKSLQELRNESNHEKNEMQSKIEQIRAKHQEALDELTQKRIDFERDKALKSQQLQFQEQRINELAKQLEDTIRRYDERIKQEREDLQKDMYEKIQRIQGEKESSDQKYEQKRKAMKDLESNMNKSLTQTDRERAVMLEKYQNLETQQKELIRNYESEIVKLRETNEQLGTSLNSDKQSIHQEVERWRNQFLEMERQFQDQNNNYDKDKALWEGKFKFLEQQKETAKKDLEDAQKKFQMTLESLQKNQNDNKNKTENTHQMMVSQMESKYNQRIKDLQENQSNILNEIKAKNKDLERQNKMLNEKFEITTKSKQTEQGGLEKKVEKLLDEKDRLQGEMEDIKSERDKKIIEYQAMLDKERENYKLKLRETEGKGNRVEAKQTELILNHEKEKAKWDHEKSYLMSQKEDAVEHSQRLEKRVENLLRENEKIRNDMKASKKNLYQAAANTNSYQAAMVGNKILNSLQSNYGIKGSMSGVNKADGSGTDRSNLGNLGGLQSIMNASKETKTYIGSGDKSFASGTNTSMTQGAVGGFGQNSNTQNNPLESSLIKNILLSTPSSKRSNDQQDSEMSSEDQASKRD